jgi:hypothetical protein
MKIITSRSDLRREISDLMGADCTPQIATEVTDSIIQDRQRPTLLGDDWANYLERQDLWAIARSIGIA